MPHPALKASEPSARRTWTVGVGNWNLALKALADYLKDARPRTIEGVSLST
jgi:hypothetical protein